MSRTVNQHSAAKELDKLLVSINSKLNYIVNAGCINRQILEAMIKIGFYQGFKAGEQKFLQHTGRPPGK